MKKKYSMPAATAAMAATLRHKDSIRRLPPKSCCTTAEPSATRGSRRPAAASTRCERSVICSTTYAPKYAASATSSSQ